MITSPALAWFRISALIFLRLSLPSGSDRNPIPSIPYVTITSRPSAEATLHRLAYRAKYIQKTAALFSEMHVKRLLGLRRLPTELLKLAGIGPKVADCILLVSLDKVCPPFKSVTMNILANPIV